MSLPKLKSPLNLISYLRSAARAPDGKPVLQQLREIARLRLSRNKLGVSEYYDYGLYDSRRFPGDLAATYVGNRVDGPIMSAVNAITWRAVDEDKLLFATVLQSLELPHPKIHAFYWDRPRAAGSIRSIVGADALKSFLREAMPYPCFGKPVDGYRSRGTAALTAYDAKSDELILGNGSRQPVERFVAQLPAPYDAGVTRTFRGHVFQEMLTSSDEVQRLVPVTGLSTVRMVFLCDSPNPELFRAAWKIPVGGNMADNFWRPGNLLADIDIETGTVRRVIRSLKEEGFEVVVDDKENLHDLRGARVPHWEAAIDMCRRAASAFPETRCQHWDVGLSHKGPLLIELNALGDLSLLQSVSPKGVLDERFKTFLSRVGVTWDSRGIRTTV